MIWILTPIYFLSWALMFRFGYYLYGEALIRLGEAGKFDRSIGFFIANILLLCLGVAPLVIAVIFQRYSGGANPPNFIHGMYFLFCYGLAVIYSRLFFNKRYLKKLIKLGFQERRY